MLTLYKPDGTAVPLDINDYYIREIASGLDELVFSVSIWHPAYEWMQEEAQIDEASDDGAGHYIIKAIDGGGKSATIKAQLDLDAWRGTIKVSYEQTGTVADIANDIKPAGWTVVDMSGLTESRTVENPGATPLEIMEQLTEDYQGAAFRYDTITRTVTIRDLFNGPDLGAYLTRELNLKDVQYKGKSTSFITRLYPYGKDGLSIEEVNGGLPYLDNNTYSSRVICGYWQDDAYTFADNLKDAAQVRLDELAVPERAYSCDVADLAAAAPDKYSNLTFEMFTRVGLIDETRSDVKIMHRVIERWRYPEQTEKNKVILSNAPRKIQVQVKEALKPITNSRLAAGAISPSKIQPLAVEETKLADNSVTVNKIVNGAVVSVKIADDAVTESKVLNKAIVMAKLSDDLQLLIADIVAANAIFSNVIDNQGGVSTNVLTVRNNMYYKGQELLTDGITVSFTDTQYSQTASVRYPVYNSSNVEIGYVYAPGLISAGSNTQSHTYAVVNYRNANQAAAINQEVSS